MSCAVILTLGNVEPAPLAPPRACCWPTLPSLWGGPLSKLLLGPASLPMVRNTACLPCTLFEASVGSSLWIGSPPCAALQTPRWRSRSGWPNRPVLLRSWPTLRARLCPAGSQAVGTASWVQPVGPAWWPCMAHAAPESPATPQRSQPATNHSNPPAVCCYCPSR